MAKEFRLRAASVLISCLVFACGPSTSAYSGWEATHVSDPVTGQSRCVVAHYDNFASIKFPRTAYLYPVIEQHPKYGLLVGVSSGGTIRLPVGDVLWRVDNNPHHRLLAADSPVEDYRAAALEMARTGALNEQHAAAMENAVRSITGMMSPNTFATGDRARKLLDEMLHGSTLLFRSAAADPGLGLPTGAAQSVGIVQGGQHAPIPLDASFRQALTTCGIAS